MINDLKRRIAGIFSLLSILVLILVLSLTFFNAKKQIETYANEMFGQQVHGMISRVIVNGNIENSQIKDFISQNDIYIYVEDNGNKTNFSLKYPDTIINSVKLKALEQGVALDSPLESKHFEQSFIISLKSKNDARAIVSQNLGKNNNWISIIAVQDRQKELLEIQNLTSLYIAIGIIGIVLMLLISWLLSEIAIKPTKESMQIQKEFIAAASHEIRSPLAVIKASLSAMQVDKENFEQFEKTIQREIDRMSRLTSDLFLLSDNDSVSWTLKKTEVNIDTLCINMFESFLPLAKENEKNLKLNLPPEVFPIIIADFERLQQLLSILLNNAISHNTKGTTVTIGGSYSSKLVRIYIQDNGIGIPKKLEKKIFNSFFRIDESRSEKKNMGLGLSIAKEISESHGGRLFYKPTDGGGSTFVLEIPR